MSRALDLLAGLRLLPSPLLSTFVWKLAREVAVDADRSAAAAHRARGERDEARADRDAARAAEAACYEREAATARRVAEREKALRAKLEVANRSCVELQCETDRARAERDALAVEAQGLRAELASALRRGDSRPPPAESSAPSCSWCLGPADDGAFVDGAETMPLCFADYTKPNPTCADIIARVAIRAASCPARRTSPDPLAVECINCGAKAGVACTP